MVHDLTAACLGVQELEENPVPRWQEVGRPGEPQLSAVQECSRAGVAAQAAYRRVSYFRRRIGLSSSVAN
jgi:hypothetical protein